MRRVDTRALRRLVFVAITVIAGLLITAWAQPVSAAQDPREQREQVRRRRAAAAADVDALRANEAQVRQALADIQANLAGQQAALADAQRAEAQANEAAAQAREREQAMQQRILTIKGEIRQVAVRAYMGDGSAPAAGASTASTNVDDLVGAMYLRNESDRRVGLSDQLRVAERDLGIARKDADDNAAVAAQKRNEIEQRVSEVDAARRQQASFAADVEARLDQRLSEAANLSAVDAQLSSRIAREEAAVAARLPRGGTSSTASSRVGSGSLTTVRGITVASSIADQLERMLAAAQADGIVFGGSGYRDSSAQEALRRQNCPDPANSPPSACSPPTARAGSSMHERGLAVDFTYGGRVISSRDSPGFQWLANNAGRFGFSNLPSEPWHWSANGQ